MYIPRHFAETRVDVLHQLIRDEPFGTLVTLGSDGLEANHLPFELDAAGGPFGTLRGHVSRANAVCRGTNADVEALAIFQGPQRYVTLARFFAENISVQAPSLERTVMDGAEAVTGADAVLLG